jgi:lipoprotein-anchoring transpeptidase ErfK/SrfK
MGVSRRDFIALGAGMAAFPGVAGAVQTPGGFEIEPRFLPQMVRVKSDFPQGSIIIRPAAHYLYFISEPKRAIRYGIGVGKAGLGFYGSATIARKAEWPSWRPTQSMIARDPKYARWADGMPGGPNNPLGARALYLYQNGRDTYYRIHGTTQPQSIGRSQSNGCFRMINSHVAHLYDVAPVGTQVYVLKG